jgi:hypothetical protein
MRAEPTLADATIVVLTGDSGEVAERSAQAPGADVFPTKPFSPAPAADRRRDRQLIAASVAPP